jgi:benzoyl-CoA 2,3-dioxygenase component B
MFVGTTGVDRVVDRTARLMREHDTDDIRAHGGIPLDIIQRYLNFHFSVSLDLFGGETSSNVAAYFTAGLKGRWQETRRRDDHRLVDSRISVDRLVDGRPGSIEVPAVTGLNQDLRREYVLDCENGLNRWNRILEEAGVEQRLRLPHQAFNRHVGAFSGIHVSPAGEVVDDAGWERRRDQWLPGRADLDFVASLMQPVHEPGRIAGWVSPPKVGINDQGFEYDYVRFA